MPAERKSFEPSGVLTISSFDYVKEGGLSETKNPREQPRGKPTEKTLRVKKFSQQTTKQEMDAKQKYLEKFQVVENRDNTDELRFASKECLNADSNLSRDNSLRKYRPNNIYARVSTIAIKSLKNDGDFSVIMKQVSSALLKSDVFRGTDISSKQSKKFQSDEISDLTLDSIIKSKKSFFSPKSIWKWKGKSSKKSTTFPNIGIERESQIECALMWSYIGLSVVRCFSLQIEDEEVLAIETLSNILENGITNYYVGVNSPEDAVCEVAAKVAINTLSLSKNVEISSLVSGEILDSGMRYLEEQSNKNKKYLKEISGKKSTASIKIRNILRSLEMENNQKQRIQSEGEELAVRTASLIDVNSIGKESLTPQEKNVIVNKRHQSNLDTMCENQVYVKKFLHTTNDKVKTSQRSEMSQKKESIKTKKTIKSNGILERSRSNILTINPKVKNSKEKEINLDDSNEESAVLEQVVENTLVENNLNSEKNQKPLDENSIKELLVEFEKEEKTHEDNILAFQMKSIINKRSYKVQPGIFECSEEKYKTSRYQKVRDFQEDIPLQKKFEEELLQASNLFKDEMEQGQEEEEEEEEEEIFAHQEDPDYEKNIYSEARVFLESKFPSQHKSEGVLDGEIAGMEMKQEAKIQDEYEEEEQEEEEEHKFENGNEPRYHRKKNSLHKSSSSKNQRKKSKHSKNKTKSFTDATEDDSILDKNHIYKKQGQEPQGQQSKKVTQATIMPIQLQQQQQQQQSMTMQGQKNGYGNIKNNNVNHEPSPVEVLGFFSFLMNACMCTPTFFGTEEVIQSNVKNQSAAAQTYKKYQDMITPLEKKSLDDGTDSIIL